MVAALVSSLFTCTICFAQQVVGTSIVDGKVVELLSDSTWRYKHQEVGGCKLIEYNLRFCGEGIRWINVPPSGEAVAMYKDDDSNYGEFLIEHVGSTQGLTLDAIRKAIIGNAADAAKVKPQEISTLGDEETSVDGYKAETVTYLAVLDKIPVVYYNTIVVTESATVQIMTWSLATDVTPEAKRLHSDFVSQTHLK
jgi:hypothetical protein